MFHQARSLLAAIGLLGLALGCGEEPAPAPKQRVVEVQVVDAQGVPQGDVYVSAHNYDYGQFFFGSDVEGRTDTRGIATLEFTGERGGERWFDAFKDTKPLPLSSLAAAARVVSHDIDTTTFFQLTVRPFESGLANLPGEWKWIGSDGGYESISIQDDLSYTFRNDDGSADTGKCIFKQQGWIQGHLTCSPADGFIPWEFFVTALTERYLGLEWNGDLMLYEKQGVPEPSMGTARPEPGAGGSAGFPSPPDPPATGGQANTGVGPGAPERSELECNAPHAGYGRSCASDQDCGCDAPVCLPVLHYCSRVGCDGGGSCIEGFDCTQLGSPSSGAPWACLREDADAAE